MAGNIATGSEDSLKRASLYVHAVNYIDLMNVFLETYTLIYAFLNKRSHTKAASAVAKAAKDVVDVESATIPDGAKLEDLVKEWQASRCVAL